jgi:hypothetical protein
MKPRLASAIILLFSVIGFLSCIKDPCESNFCNHGGVCMDGSCDCPDGYAGSHCVDQVQPLKMSVTAITMTRFPSTNEGTPWDSNDGPDIYFKMSEEVYPLAQPEYLVENAEPLKSYTFFIHPFDLRYVTSPYKMEMFDFDGVNTDPQKMGELFFTPYADHNGFPQTLILDDGGMIAFTVEVQYIFPDKM